MTKIYNIHQILNKLDKAYGRNRISVKIHSVDGYHIYLKIIYQTNINVPEKYRYGNNIIDHHYKTSGAMIRLWLQETPEDITLCRPAEYKLLLFKDNIYANSYIMPDVREAEKFIKAAQSLSSNPADYIIGGWEINLGPTLTKQLKTTIKAEYEHLQKKINKNINGKTYWYTTQNVESEWNTHMRKLKHLLSVMDWALFSKSDTK